MTIIIAQQGMNAQKLEAKAIPRENYLQEFIQANPEALPMDEIREDIRLLVVAKEFDTPSGPIDAIAIDQDGEIYIVETKLYKNPDKRTVLAQALDYGAALWSSEEGAGAVLARLREQANSTLGKKLLSALQEDFGLDDSSSDEVLQALKTNIENGALRFVILMDRLDDRLKNLIRFVNENSRFTVYGVELEFYEFEEHEIVIPKLYGAEVRKEFGSGSPRRTWNEKEFFEDARSRLDSGMVDAIQKLYEFATETSDLVTWGTGVTVGSFNPKYESISRPALFTAYSDGRLSLNYGGLIKTEVGQKVAKELATGVQRILEIEPPAEFESSYPHMRPLDWCPRVDDVISLLGEIVTRDEQN